jgi:hypothetical protein
MERVKFINKPSPDTLPTESSDATNFGRSGGRFKERSSRRIGSRKSMRTTLPPILGWRIGCGVPSLKP